MSTVTARESAVDRFGVRLTSNPAPDARRRASLASPVFGAVFTDHMARVTWTVDRGWHDRRVVAHEPVGIHPSAAILHYGQEVFEGLKAYRHGDGSLWTFRPELNAARFAASAARLALPVLAAEDFIGAVDALVRTDRAWVPTGEEMSLYLRPFLFASEPTLLVRPAREAEMLVIASPVGPYFPTGVKPVSVWVPTDQHRAGPGGTGAAKTGGNYGASLAALGDAVARGFDQVCFLDATTRTHLEELGAMNVFVVRSDGAVATPALNGSLLEGVTRASLITLLRDVGHDVVEGPVRLDEVTAGLADGSVREMFACGTGAVVTPIGRFAGAGFDHVVGDGGTGPVTAAVRRRLVEIQYGRAEDVHGWLHRVR